MKIYSTILGEFLNKKKQFFNFEKYTSIEKIAIYKFLYGCYKLNDFISIRSMLCENALICYNVIKTIKDEKDLFRDKVFEEKVLNFLELYLQSLKNIEPSDFEKFIKTYINYREINIDAHDFIKQANNVINVLYKLNTEITDNVFKYNSCIYNAISEYLEGCMCPEEANCNFKICFKEELCIDIRDFKCDFYDKPIDDFAVVIPPIDGNVEYKLSDEYLTSCKMILGEKLGNKIFGINKYCINHSAVFNDAESFFASDKDEPLFYIITQLIKALNLLMLETENEKIEYFINNNFKDFLELQIQGAIYGCSILFDFLMINPMQYIKDCMIKIFRGIPSYETKINLLELYDRFEQDNFEVINRDFFKNLPYRDNKLQEHCFKTKINLFIKYFCGGDVPFGEANIIKNNIDVLNEIEDHIILNILLNECKKIKEDLGFKIRREIGRLPTKQIMSILRQLFRELNDFVLGDVYDIELFKTLTQAIQHIKQFNIVTPTANALKTLLNQTYNDLDTFYKMNIWEYGFEVYDNYKTAIELEKDIEERLFNIVYKDQIEQIRLESEQYIEKYKKELEQKSKYDRKIYYDNFINNLLKNAKQQSEICIDDFETIKDDFMLKYKEIISNYQTEEIRDCFATNEYMYYSMNNQNIEKTPLFVCFLKGVEQFLCAYINYLVLKDTKLKDLRDDAQYIRIKAENNQKFLITSKTNWNKLKATGGDLSDYINKRFEINNKILNSYLIEKFKEMSTKWINSARNGNLHKDNVYLDYKVKEYIQCCYSVITYAILTLIL